MKLLQNCWSELLMLNVLHLQTCHNRNDVFLVVRLSHRVPFTVNAEDLGEMHQKTKYITARNN